MHADKNAEADRGGEQSDDSFSGVEISASTLPPLPAALDEVVPDAQAKRALRLASAKQAQLQASQDLEEEGGHPTRIHRCSFQGVRGRRLRARRLRERRRP